MREKKFKVWDIHNSKMVLFDFGDIELCDGVPVINYNNDYHVDLYRNPIMQYTALKDKQSKDIYEFDLLKSSGTDICIVKWITEIAGFVLENIEDETDIILLHEGNVANREIIGNKFETSDLTQKTSA